jgi:hypothetical protein
VVQKCFCDAFGSGLDVAKIPILSTEGGVFTPESTSMFGHDRLRTDEEHAARVVEMFRWLKEKSPLKAMCPWCLAYDGFDSTFDSRFRDDGWFKTVNGGLQPRAVVEAMKKIKVGGNRSKVADKVRDDGWSMEGSELHRKPIPGEA